MTFRFGRSSEQKLEGIKADLVKVASRALEMSQYDFGVVQGRRTVEEQRVLVEKGLSQTMRSKHLTGDAIDIALYRRGEGYTWEPFDHFVTIADAFAEAAFELGTRVRWGGAWTTPDIGTYYPGSMQDALAEYKASRRKPFLDAGHFELN